MISAYLTYLSKDEKIVYLELVTFLLRDWFPGGKHDELITDTQKELHLDNQNLFPKDGCISYFSTRPIRIKRIILIEIVTIFQPLGIQSSQIKEFGHSIGLPDHETEVLFSWAEDYCEFIETGYMFINSKL